MLSNRVWNCIHLVAAYGLRVFRRDRRSWERRSFVRCVLVPHDRSIIPRWLKAAIELRDVHPARANDISAPNMILVLNHCLQTWLLASAQTYLHLLKLILHSLGLLKLIFHILLELAISEFCALEILARMRSWIDLAWPNLVLRIVERLQLWRQWQVVRDICERGSLLHHQNC